MTDAANGTKTGDALLVATFRLGDGAFGIDTGIVQEVVLTGELTPVHHAPRYVAGIRNLRGKIVTVIDLRVRLELGAVEPGPENRILIVEWKGEPVGLLVDSVADTVAVEDGRLEPAPSNLHGVKGRNLRGVFRGDENLVAVLDPGPVLDVEEERAGKAAPVPAG